MIFKNRTEKLIGRLTEISGLNVGYFLKNGFWVFIRYIIIGLSGLIISISFTRLGTKQLLGQYQVVLNFLALVSVFSLPGLNAVALRDVALKKERTIGEVIKTSFFWSFLGVPIIAGYGIYQILHGNTMLGETMALAGVLFPFFYAPNTWYTFFEGRAMFKSATIRIIAVNIIIALTMAGALYFKVGLLWTVFTFLFTNIVMNGIYYIEVLKKSKKFSGKLDIRYGISCTLQKFTYSFSESIPALVVAAFFGFESVATYQIAYFLIALVIGFTSALSATYMPLLFKYKEINYYKIIWQNLLIGLAFFIGFLIFIKLFFFILYGKNYQESYDLAKIFSLAIIFMPLRIYLFNFYSARNKNYFLIASNLISNGIALLVFYLIKNTGFAIGIVVYFYLFSLLAIAPLITYYFLMASKKTDSILSEIN